MKKSFETVCSSLFFTVIGDKNNFLTNEISFEHTFIPWTSVSDPYSFDTDPDPDPAF
jgi:hypothetical protein